MSMVIKASTANGAVRRFIPAAVLNGGLAGAEPEHGAEALPVAQDPVRDEEKEALLEEVADLRRTLISVEEAALEAETRAREEGRKQALESALEAETGRQAVLEEAIARLTTSWDERLQDLDGLAALIARSALSKLFESWDDSVEFTARTIARQIALLRRETIIAIRISPDDFPDEQAIATLAARAGTGSVRLIADSDLAPGECRADLQLGHVDLGIATQRTALLSLLDSLAAGGDVA